MSWSRRSTCRIAIDRVSRGAFLAVRRATIGERLGPARLCAAAQIVVACSLGVPLVAGPPAVETARPAARAVAPAQAGSPESPPEDAGPAPAAEVAPAAPEPEPTNSPPATASGSQPAGAFGSAVASAGSLPCGEILELSARHARGDPKRAPEVSFEAVFTSPSGDQRRVRGFHDSGDLWKLRFRPDQPGHWSYAYAMKEEGGAQTQGNGEFGCTPGPSDGPVRRDPRSPFRWIFANGKPYFPLGLESCIGVKGSPAPQLSMVIDGEGRDEGKGRRVSADEYFEIHGQAGFNLLRFSQRNCSYSLIEGPDRYSEAASAATDELLALARRHGLRVMFGIFGTYIPREGKDADGTLALDPASLARDKRFVDYAVARWGVYADFWELLNEGRASDLWTTTIAEYVRSIDPDRKPIATSLEKPELAAIDINEPHWYESESELQSDQRVHQKATEWKKAGKPVIVGEQGNTGMNWDPLSAVRMRVRAWTALFEEVSFVFWDTSWAKDGMHGGRYAPGKVANIYLGPEERAYVRSLQAFSARLEAGTRPAPVHVSSSKVRAYALRSDGVAAAYLHHFESHKAAARGIKIRLELPGDARSTSDLVGEWIDPATGSVISRATLRPGRQTLEAPPFAIDVALLVSSTPK